MYMYMQHVYATLCTQGHLSVQGYKTQFVTSILFWQPLCPYPSKMALGTV